MGYYTEFRFKAALRTDTPKEVIEFLNKVINEKDIGVKHDRVLFKSEDVSEPPIEHDFFKCSNWYMLFLSNNWDADMQGGLFYKQSDRWVIDLHTEFKNYDSEIDKFINWVSPFIVGRKKKKYVGYRKGEASENRSNIYINQQPNIKGEKSHV